MLLHQYISSVLHEVPETRYLSQQIRALEHLVDTPTARLERVFAEHIDLCSYRLDAWWMGLVNYQLKNMRQRRFVDRSRKQRNRKSEEKSNGQISTGQPTMIGNGLESSMSSVHAFLII